MLIAEIWIYCRWFLHLLSFFGFGLQYSVANKEAYLASHKRKVKVARKEVPRSALDLKENIKACIKDNKMPVVQADDKEDGWREFQELVDFEVFLLDCRFLNDDTVSGNVHIWPICFSF